jgi:hypothetical protein
MSWWQKLAYVLGGQAPPEWEQDYLNRKAGELRAQDAGMSQDDAVAQARIEMDKLYMTSAALHAAGPPDMDPPPWVARNAAGRVVAPPALGMAQPGGAGVPPSGGAGMPPAGGGGGPTGPPGAPPTVVYPRGPGAADGPVPPGYVPVSRWVDQAEAELWLENQGTHIPNGIGRETQRVYVTTPEAKRPGGTGPIRIDFQVPQSMLTKAGGPNGSWYQIMQPAQNAPIYNVTLHYSGR